MSRGRSKAALIRTLVLCAAGGVAMTVLVAGMCLFYSPASKTLEDHGGVSGDEAETQPVGSVRFKRGALYAGLGYREWTNYWIWVPPPGARPTAPNWVFSKVTGAGVREDQCGWPFIAFVTPLEQFPLSCSTGTAWEAAVHAAYLHPTVANQMPAWLGVKKYREWPTRPVLAGLVGNSAIYGALIAGVVFEVPAGRRFLRRRGGRCEACGYAVAGLPRCPECGAEVVWRVGRVMADLRLGREETRDGAPSGRGGTAATSPVAGGWGREAAV